MKTNRGSHKIGEEKGMVLVTALLLITVLLLLGSTAVMTTTTDMKIASNYREGVRALYNAEAGVAQVIEYLKTTPSFTYPATTGSSTTISVTPLSGYLFNGSISIQYVGTNTYKFQVTGTGANNASRTIEVVITRSSIIPSGTDGAVAMYGTGPTVRFSGSKVKIDGRNYSLPAAFACTGSGCNGSLTGSGDVTGFYTTVTPATPDGTAGYIAGTPLAQVGGGQNTDQEWIDLANYIVANNLYVDNVLGTRSAPLITRVPSGTTMTGNSSGAGILLIEDGGTFTSHGTAHFEGLVLILGNGTITATGTFGIFGSLITASHTAQTVDCRGGVEMQYSSQAISNLSLISSLQLVQQRSWNDVE